MNEDLKKALESLIDETINEIEELKKSRFDAAEIKLAGPGEDGIKGHSANGHLDKKDDDKDDDSKEDAELGEEVEEKVEEHMKHNKKAEQKEGHKMSFKKEEDGDDDDKDDDEAEKSEGHNRQADPDGGHHKAPVEGMKRGQGDSPQRAPKDAKGSTGGVNREADPDGGKHRAAYEGAAKGEEAEKSDMGYMKGAIKKSEEEMSTLMKSFVDERLAPLETKLSSILDLVNKLADQPVPAKGVSARVVPLTKSADSETEPLSKSAVSSKLFELKKSGTKVDSLDVTKAELGQDLQAIAKKYSLAN